MGSSACCRPIAQGEYCSTTSTTPPLASSQWSPCAPSPFLASPFLRRGFLALLPSPCVVGGSGFVCCLRAAPGSSSSSIYSQPIRPSALELLPVGLGSLKKIKFPGYLLLSLSVESKQTGTGTFSFPVPVPVQFTSFTFCSKKKPQNPNPFDELYRDRNARRRVSRSC